MQMIIGTVVDGKIVVEGEPLSEGSFVTVLARDATDVFEVPVALEADLAESIAEMQRGEVISADDLVRRLRRNV